MATSVRTKRISVRVTEEAHDRCVAAANRDGRGLAAWVRWTLHQATQPATRKAKKLAKPRKVKR